MYSLVERRPHLEEAIETDQRSQLAREHRKGKESDPGPGNNRAPDRGLLPNLPSMSQPEGLHSDRDTDAGHQAKRDQDAQQLCKHFGHKIDATYADGRGECRFDAGTAVLDADADGVTIKVSSSDSAGNERLQQVIESHLLRFAFLEQLPAFQWDHIQ